MGMPRPEYPRPQFKREQWLCLNGPWQFEIDHGDSGLERGLRERSLAQTITVPFCPESKLSGIEHTDFMNAVWYRREVTIPEAWRGQRILLHFQAVDYDATVWVNGMEVGRHRGGWCGFSCELHGTSAGDRITIVVRARDDHRQNKPQGKQCPRYANYGCLYTRTTGIWQTVWLEPVPQVYLKRPRLTPDVANSMIRLVQPVSNNALGTSIRATLRDDAGMVCTAVASAELSLSPALDLPIPTHRRCLWAPSDTHLYDLDIELLDANGGVLDRVTSYAGLRSVSIDGQVIRLNGRPVFQRLVLDQGYYPDGILTAAADEALRRDIELSIAAGFNGARLHQKVFEERFLHHADRLGYLVWGEFGDWGVDREQSEPTVVAQWLEVLQRDYSHPSIVGWCPLNETTNPITDRIDNLHDLTHALFAATKAMDASRPVLDSSGYAHRVPDADVYDAHNYEQDPAKFAAALDGLATGAPFINRNGNQTISLPYRGQPYFVSEFGGTWWNPLAARSTDQNESWGYGVAPRTVEEFYDRFARLCGALLDNPCMFGYCYTQLTDVFQEQNGIYGFDRSSKFDLARLRAIQQRPAAIEATTQVHA